MRTDAKEQMDRDPARNAVGVIEVAVGDGAGGVIIGHAWVVPDGDGLQLTLVKPEMACAD